MIRVSVPVKSKDGSGIAPLSETWICVWPKNINCVHFVPDHDGTSFSLNFVTSEFNRSVPHDHEDRDSPGFKVAENLLQAGQVEFQFTDVHNRMRDELKKLSDILKMSRLNPRRREGKYSEFDD